MGNSPTKNMHDYQQTILDNSVSNESLYELVKQMYKVIKENHDEINKLKERVKILEQQISEN